MPGFDEHVSTHRFHWFGRGLRRRTQSRSHPRRHRRRASAVAPISYWNAENWPIQVAAQITGVKDQVLVDDRKLHKSISRTDLFGIYAGDEAIKSSGLRAYRETLAEEDVPQFNDRSGLVVGSGGGSYQVNYDFFP